MGNSALSPRGAKVHIADEGSAKFPSKASMHANNDIIKQIDSAVKKKAWQTVNSLILQNTHIIQNLGMINCIEKIISMQCPLDVLKTLIQIDTDCALKTTNAKAQTIVHLALLYEREIEMVRYLLNEVPNAVSQGDVDGFFPLHIALTVRSQLPVVQLLLEKSPDSIKSRTKIGSLPLHVALSHRQTEEIVLFVLSRHLTATKYSAASFLPLHLACRHGHGASVIEAIIRENPDAVCVSGPDSYLPLHYAFSTTKTPLESIVRMVELNHDALLHRTKTGYLPIHLAIENRAQEAKLLFLLESCPQTAKQRGRGTPGDFPLSLAIDCQASSTILLRLLQLYPEATNQKNVYRMHLLRSAIRAKVNWNVIDAILDAYPHAAAELDTSSTSSAHRLALHYAVSRSYPLHLVAKILASYPPAVSARDVHGQLPIHLAAIRAGSLDTTRDPARVATASSRKSPRGIESTSAEASSSAGGSPDDTMTSIRAKERLEYDLSLFTLLLFRFPQSAMAVDEYGLTPLNYVIENTQILHLQLHLGGGEIAPGVQLLQLLLKHLPIPEPTKRNKGVKIVEGPESHLDNDPDAWFDHKVTRSGAEALPKLSSSFAVPAPKLGHLPPLLHSLQCHRGADYFITLLKHDNQLHQQTCWTEDGTQMSQAISVSHHYRAPNTHRTLLHLAILHKLSDEGLLALLEVAPETAAVRDSVDIIRDWDHHDLEMMTTTTSISNPHLAGSRHESGSGSGKGYLPIHYALQRQYSRIVLQRLLALYPVVTKWIDDTVHMVFTSNPEVKNSPFSLKQHNNSERQDDYPMSEKANRIVIHERNDAETESGHYFLFHFARHHKVAPGILADIIAHNLPFHLTPPVSGTGEDEKQGELVVSEARKTSKAAQELVYNVEHQFLLFDLVCHSSSQQEREGHDTSVRSSFLEIADENASRGDIYAARCLERLLDDHIFAASHSVSPQLMVSRLCGLMGQRLLPRTTLLSAATPRCHALLVERLYFHGRFAWLPSTPNSKMDVNDRSKDINSNAHAWDRLLHNNSLRNQQPGHNDLSFAGCLHRSRTSVCHAALDHLPRPPHSISPNRTENDGDDKAHVNKLASESNSTLQQRSQSVVLKFTTQKASFLNEVHLRRNLQAVLLHQERARQEHIRASTADDDHAQKEIEAEVSRLLGRYLLPCVAHYDADVDADYRRNVQRLTSASASSPYASLVLFPAGGGDPQIGKSPSEPSEADHCQTTQSTRYPRYLLVTTKASCTLQHLLWHHHPLLTLQYDEASSGLPLESFGRFHYLVHRILLSLAEAVHFLHTQGYVHGALDPSHVYFMGDLDAYYHAACTGVASSDFRVVLGNLGYARRLTNEESFAANNRDETSTSGKISSNLHALSSTITAAELLVETTTGAQRPWAYLSPETARLYIHAKNTSRAVPPSALASSLGKDSGPRNVEGANINMAAQLATSDVLHESNHPHSVIAPEVISTSKVDERTNLTAFPLLHAAVTQDLWSLGALAYHLGAGESLWHTPSYSAQLDDDQLILLTHVCTQDETVLTRRLGKLQHHVQLRHLVQTLLQPSPRLRPVSVHYLLQRHPFFRMHPYKDSQYNRISQHPLSENVTEKLKHADNQPHQVAGDKNERKVSSGLPQDDHSPELAARVPIDEHIRWVGEPPVCDFYLAFNHAHFVYDAQKQSPSKMISSDRTIWQQLLQALQKMHPTAHLHPSQQICKITGSHMFLSHDTSEFNPAAPCLDEIYMKQPIEADIIRQWAQRMLYDHTPVSMVQPATGSNDPETSSSTTKNDKMSTTHEKMTRVLTQILRRMTQAHSAIVLLTRHAVHHPAAEKRHSERRSLLSVDQVDAESPLHLFLFEVAMLLELRRRGWFAGGIYVVVVGDSNLPEPHQSDKRHKGQSISREQQVTPNPTDPPKTTSEAVYGPFFAHYVTPAPLSTTSAADVLRLVNAPASDPANTTRMLRQSGHCFPDFAQLSRDSTLTLVDSLRSILDMHGLGAVLHNQHGDVSMHSLFAQQLLRLPTLDATQTSAYPVLHVLGPASRAFQHTAHRLWTLSQPALYTGADGSSTLLSHGETQDPQHIDRTIEQTMWPSRAVTTRGHSRPSQSAASSLPRAFQQLLDQRIPSPALHNMTFQQPTQAPVNIHGGGQPQSLHSAPVMVPEHWFLDREPSPQPRKSFLLQQQSQQQQQLRQPSDPTLQITTTHQQHKQQPKPQQQSQARPIEEENLRPVSPMHFQRLQDLLQPPITSAPMHVLSTDGTAGHRDETHAENVRQGFSPPSTSPRPTRISFESDPLPQVSLSPHGMWQSPSSAHHRAFTPMTPQSQYHALAPPSTAMSTPYFTEIVAQQSQQQTDLLQYCLTQHEVQEHQSANLQVEVLLLQERVRLQQAEIQRLRRLVSVTSVRELPPTYILDEDGNPLDGTN